MTSPNTPGNVRVVPLIPVEEDKDKLTHDHFKLEKPTTSTNSSSSQEERPTNTQTDNKHNLPDVVVDDNQAIRQSEDVTTPEMRDDESQITTKNVNDSTLQNYDILDKVNEIISSSNEQQCDVSVT